MKKILLIIILGIFTLNSCADYKTERKQLKLENEKLVLNKKREKDGKTCEYYGFKKGTAQFSNCLMKIDIARKDNIRTRKMLECEAVRRDNANSGVTGFWGGVLMGARENLVCD